MRHLKLKKVKKLTLFQRLAIGTWATAKDPSIYSLIDVDYEKAQELSDEIFKEKHIKITPTYMLGQAAALIYTARPQLNVILRMGQIYQRDIVSISFLIAMDKQKDTGKTMDLSNCVLHNLEKSNLLDLYEKLKIKIDRTKDNKEVNRQAQSNVLGKVPSPLMELFLDFTSFIMYTLNLRPPTIPYDPFGALMISNLGQMGVDTTFVPLIPYSKVPMLLALGLVKPRVLATENKEIEVRNMLRISGTIDHRYIDGKSLSIMKKMLDFVFADPKKWLMGRPIDIKEEFLDEFYKSLS